MHVSDIAPISGKILRRCLIAVNIDHERIFNRVQRRMVLVVIFFVFLSFFFFFLALLLLYLT